MTQVRPGIRDLIRELEAHRDEVFTEQDFDIFMQDDRYRDRYEDWSQDLWWVLIEKATGDALLRVKGVAMGNGMEAFRRLHRWYGKWTDLGLVELRQQVLRPMQAKREEDTARCIEERQESIMELRRVDPDYVDLPDAYQTAALRGILTGKYRDHIDMKMAEREHGKDELMNEVRRYAAIKRHERRSPSAMDIDAVSQSRRRATRGD